MFRLLGADDAYYVAVYPYESTEPGDLSFTAGELITVVKKEGDWWTGVIGSRTGVFPSNYVQKAELQFEAAADSEVEAATAAGKAAAAALESFSDASASHSNGKRPNTAPVDSDLEVFCCIGYKQLLLNVLTLVVSVRPTAGCVCCVNRNRFTIKCK